VTANISNPAIPTRKMNFASYSLAPSTQHAVSFSEYPIGTQDPIYIFPDNEAHFYGTIARDGSQPDSPAISSSTGFFGPVYVSLLNPVTHVELDAGYFNNFYSTVVKFFGPDGTLLQSFYNSQHGVQRFSCDSATGISFVHVINYSYDIAGFTVDNFIFGGSVIPIDTTAPTVTNFSPADDASGVDVAGNIVITFSEAIVFGSGNIVLKTSAGSTVATWNVAASSNLTINNNTLVIDPSFDLSYGAGYKIEFTAGALKDLAGNDYAGTTTYNFTTERPPVTHQPLLLSAVNLAARAYSDAHYGDAVKANLVNQAVATWVPLNQTELGYAAGDAWFHQPGGHLLRFDNFNASATVGLTMLDGKLTLGIAFEGTNKNGIQLLADITDDIGNIDAHYKLLQGFASQVAAYADVPAHHIDQVLVSGHSLGGAMAQLFMTDFGRTDSRYVGVTFGSPGTVSRTNLPGDRFINFAHDGDPVPDLGFSRRYSVEGSTIKVTNDVSGLLSEHNLFFADDSNTLGQGVSYRNSIEFLSDNLSEDILFGGYDMTVGTNAADHLSGDHLSGALSRSVVYGLAGDDTMVGSVLPFNDWFQGGTGDDVISGGRGKDTAAYSGVRSDYEIISLHSDSLEVMGAPDYTVKDLNRADGNEGTDSLWSIEILRFADQDVTLHRPVHGGVVDGYIAGASIYIDDNGNGLPDASENTGVLSDAHGQFAFETTLSGSIIAVGGTNIDTGLPNLLTLIAPEGSTVVTPLTTLIQSYAVQNGKTDAEAETAVQSALGIDANIDIMRYDPLAQAGGDATALAVQRAASQMAELGRVTLTTGLSFDSITSGIATRIAAGQSLNLADRAQLQALLGNDPDRAVLNAAVATNQAIAAAQSIQAISTIQLNAFNGNGGNPVEDVLPPTVTAFAPDNNATGISPNSNIVLNFSENIARGSGSIVLRHTATGVTVAAYDAATSSNLSISGETLTLDPSNDLSYNTGYSIEFGNGTIKDLAGNDFAGTTDYHFTTATSTVADTTAPTIASFSPADEATGVPLSSDIHITFSESIQRGTGFIVLKNSDSGATVATYDAASSSAISISGRSLTLNPTANLAYNTGYSVEFGNGTVKDLASNNFIGTTSYNFTTTATAVDTSAPTISSFNPADDATGVPLAGDILITFSESIQRGSGFIVLKNTANGASVATYDAANSSVTSVEIQDESPPVHPGIF